MLRVIIDKRRNPYFNMGLDEALLLGKTFTLRLYGWEPPSVTFGYFQRINEFIDIEKCEKLGVPYTRRISGGGAVLHMYELTYSIVGHKDVLGKWPEESFEIILEFIVSALKNLGINAKREGINDIVVNNKKISGNAQARKDDRVLQHGTILLDVNRELMDLILKIPGVKSQDKKLKRVSDRVTTIKEVLGKIPSREVITSAFVESAMEHFGKIYIGSLNENEIILAEELANAKYKNREWIFRK